LIKEVAKVMPRTHGIRGRDLPNCLKSCRYVGGEPAVCRRHPRTATTRRP
jgi:hypothetical protein